MNNFDKRINEIYFESVVCDEILEESVLDDIKKWAIALGISVPIIIGLFKTGQVSHELLTKDPGSYSETEIQSIADGFKSSPVNLPRIDDKTQLPPDPDNPSTANIEPPTGIVRHQRPPVDTPERVLDDEQTRQVIEDYIIGHEEIRLMAYDDGANNPTIGIGHFLTGEPDDRAIFQRLFDNELNYDRLVAGSGQVRRGRGVAQVNLNLSTTPRGVELLRRGVRPQSMDREQVRILFSRDIPVYINRATNNLIRYNIDLEQLSPRHQAAWIDLQFRGDFGTELRRGINVAREAKELGTIITTLQTRAQGQRLDHVRNRINSNADIIRAHLQELLPSIR